MRIPYPERIPIQYAAYFALALFVIQLAEGTELYFCIGCALFIILATFTFNAAGGLNRTAGVYVFFYSLLVVIVGLCYKAFLGEPAQKNLTDPRTDIAAYLGTIVAIYATVLVSRRLAPKRAFLQGVLDDSRMYRASVGCVLFGTMAGYGIGLLGESGRQLATAFSQLNNLVGVGITLGTIYEIRRSGGTRCTNLSVICGAGVLLFFGTTGFSKAGMIAPIICWLLPMWAYRYRFSRAQIACIAIYCFILFRYLVPYAQYGRDQVPQTATFGERVSIAARLLANPEKTRQAYLHDQQEMVYANQGLSGSYFDSPQGFWDRLQFISVDDSLISFTNQHQTFGLLPIKYAFINIVPHFIWPDKPGINAGNAYSHEINGIAQGEGDTTTGISFSPASEAYHLEGWAGIFVLAPLMWFMLFFIYDALLGDLRSTPWGLLAIVTLAHSAPEGGISFIPYQCSFGVEALVFCAFFARWVAPALSTLVLGPERGDPPVLDMAQGGL